jgi:hypothetical protein
MSEMGHKLTFRPLRAISVDPSKADITSLVVGALFT